VRRNQDRLAGTLLKDDGNRTVNRLAPLKVGRFDRRVDGRREEYRLSALHDTDRIVGGRFQADGHFRFLPKKPSGSGPKGECGARASAR